MKKGLAKYSVLAWVLLAMMMPAWAGLQPGQAGFSLSLKDQYDQPMDFPVRGDLLNEDGSQPAVVVILSDKEGKDQAEAWGQVLAKTYATALDRKTQPGLVVLPVAHLKGVPAIMKGMVKGFFLAGPDEPPKMAMGLDWDGIVGDQLGVQPGKAMVYVFNPKGLFLLRQSGPPTAESKQALSAALQKALIK